MTQVKNETIFNQNVDNGGEKITSEIEFVKREMNTMKMRIESLDDTIKKLNTEVDTLKTHQMVKPQIYVPSLFSILLIFIFFLILIDGVMTIKRIFFRSSVCIDQNHMKV